MSSNSNVIHIAVSDWSKSMASGMIHRLDTIDLLPDERCCCIYRVHKKFHLINEYAYKPEMISIGPLHHHETGLQEKENDKFRYLKKRVSRYGNEKLEHCFEAINEEEGQIRKCYFELVEPDKEKFITMMVVDGVFAIELFYRFYRCSLGQNETYGDNNEDYSRDLIILARDLILMENQLPMKVLKILYAMTMTNQQDQNPLSELIIRFFNLLMPREESVLQSYFKTEGKHLLDLLRKTFVQCLDKPIVPNNAGMTTALLELKHVPIPCATELRRAGVTFKKHSNAHSFLDIKFTMSVGEMEIPTIRIICQTESLLRNFIASEHYCDGNLTCMASYAFMMRSLIQTANDVALLSRYGIIDGHSGGDHETICSIFSNLCKDVSLPNFYYSEICEQVNDFRKSSWRAWKAKMMRNKYNTLTLTIAIITGLFAIFSFAIHKS